MSIPLDHFGNSHIGEARLEERYRRVDRSTLELMVTLNGPKACTKPWMGDKDF
jgi:hypothetical protein